LRSALRHARGFLGAAQPARHTGIREGRGPDQRSQTAARSRALHRGPDPRQREPGRTRRSNETLSEDRQPLEGPSHQVRARPARCRSGRRQAVRRRRRGNALIVRPPRRSLHRARQCLAGAAQRRSRADRVAEEGSRAFPDDRADRRLHAPSALRSAPRLGVVHRRRRRSDECAPPLRKRDRAVRPHSPRAYAHGATHDSHRGAFPDLRVPGSRGGRPQEADSVRPAETVSKPLFARRPGGRSANGELAPNPRRRADAARILGHRRHPATAERRSLSMKSARILALLLLSVLVVTATARGQEPRAVVITAKRFEFVPSTITLKKGETVTLVVTSEDVTHGLFLRPLKIDTDLTAGETQRVTVTPQTAGTFTAICHRFCGAGHGGMKLTVVVE